MAVQQGRSKRRGEEVRTALRVNRLPFEWILANGKAPPVLPTSEELIFNVEPPSEARTPPMRRAWPAARPGDLPWSIHPSIASRLLQ
jgi:hypothetical protein